MTVAPAVQLPQAFVAPPKPVFTNPPKPVPVPAITPTRLLAKVLAVFGLNNPAHSEGPLSALGVMAWGMFRDIEKGLFGGARGVRVGAWAPVATAPLVPAGPAPVAATRSLVAPAAAVSVSPPVANGFSVLGVPDPASGRVTGVVSFVDPAGATLSYATAASSTGGGAVSVNRTTGAFTFTPTVTQRRGATATTTDTFTVTASNGSSTASQVVTVRVDAGTPVAGTFTAGTPNAVTGVVAGGSGFTDPAGRTLSYTTSGASSSGGTVVVNASTGAYTYTPTQVQRQQATGTTTDTFTVTAFNGVNSTTRTVTVAVGAGTPQVGSLAVSGANTATGVVTSSTAGFTDPAGRTLTYSTTGVSAGGGTVSVNPTTGAFTYTPSAALRQTATLATRDTFSLTANNGVNSATRTVSVLVDPGIPVAGTPSRDAANPDSGTVTGAVVFTDTAGRALTYTTAATSRGGAAVSLNAATGVFTYTPTAAQRRTANATTTDTFTVTATNGVRSITQTVTVNVRPTVPADGVITTATPVPSSGAVTGTLRFNDSTGAPLTLSYTVPSATSTGGGTVSVNRTTGAFSYTPTRTQRQQATADTTDTFTLRATNGVDTVDQVITVGVDAGTPVAGAFTKSSPNAITGVVTGNSGVTDPVGRLLTFSTPGTSAGGGIVTVNPTTGAYTYTPTQSQRQQATATTNDTFTVTAFNGVNSTTRTVTVAVGAGTPQPVSTAWINPDQVTGVVNGPARFTDPAGRPLTYSATPTSAGGGSVVIDAATGDYVYTPTQAQRQAVTAANGTDSFVVSASNGVNTATRTVTVLVHPGTPVPGGATQGAADPATGTLQGSAVFTDTAGRPLTYAIQQLAADGGSLTVDPDTGAFTFTPTPEQRRAATSATTTNFSVRASNGLRSGWQIITVAVRPTVPTTAAFTVGEATPATGALTGTASFSDDTGGPLALTYTASATSTGGATITIDPATGAYTYTPTQAQRQNATLATNDTFTVTATNGVDTVEQTVTVPVDPGTPVAGAFTNGIPNNDTGLIAGLTQFSDTAGRTLTYTAPETSTGGGTVTINPTTGAYTYTPTQAQRQAAVAGATDTFTITAFNGVTYANQEITVTVDAGTPVVGTFTNNTPDLFTGLVSGNPEFTDPAGRPLTYSAPTTTAAGGTVFIDPDTGAYTYTPTQAQRQAATEGTSDTFTITANNGVNSSAQTITVAIDPGTPIAEVASEAITVGGLPYAVAARPGGGSVYVVNTRDNTVSVIDTGSRSVVATIEVGASPQDVQFSADGTRAFVTNGSDNTVTVIDATDRSVLAGVSVDYTPFKIAVSADGSRAYVTHAGYDTVSVIDLSGDTPAVRSIAVPNGPYGVVLSPDGNRLYVTNWADNGLTVINTATEEVTTTISTGSNPYGVAINADGSRVYVGSLSDGTVTVIDTDEESVVDTISTGVNVYGIALSPDGGRLYVTDGSSGFSVIDTATRSVLSTGNLDRGAVLLAVSTDGATAYVTDYGDSVSVVDLGPVGTVDLTTGEVTGSANFSDTAGRTLTYSTSGSTAGGGTVTVDPDTGDYVYTPTSAQRQSALANTVDTFTITADNGERTTTRTITVAVDPGTPVAGTVTPTVDSLTGEVSGNVSFTDSAGRPLIYSADAMLRPGIISIGVSAGGGSVAVDADTGDFVYTPTLEQRQNASIGTTDTFTVIADNGVRQTTRTVTVAVDPGVPVAGTATADPADVVSGVVQGQAAFTDTAGRTLTYTTTGTSTGGGTVTIDPATGAFTYTPTQAQRQGSDGSTTDTFTVTADNGARVTTTTVTVLVDAGTPVPGSFTNTAANPNTGLVSGTPAFTDTAGRSLTYTAPATSTGGGTVTIDPATGAYTYTPTQAQRFAATVGSTDTFTITAFNGVTYATQTVTVAVDAGTPVPSGFSNGTPDPITGLVSGTPGFTDPAGRTLTYSAPATSTGGGTITIDPATGAYTYTPSQAQRFAASVGSTDTFTVTVTNGVHTATQEVTVAVDAGTPVAGTFTNAAPVNATGLISGTPGITDPAGRPLTYSAPTTTAAGGTITIDPATGAYTYTPSRAQRQAADDSTTDTFTITVTNGVHTTTQTITVDVDAGTPEAGPFTNAAPVNATGLISGTTAVTDPAGRPLTYSAPTTTAAGGTITIDPTTGAYTYTPALAQRQAADDSTTDTFTVTVFNGVNSTTQTITVDVDAGTPEAGPFTNEAPVNLSGAISGTTAFTDPVGRTLTYSAPATSTGGGTITIDPTTGAYVYTPSQAQRRAATGSTTDTFTVTAFNGVNTTTQTITVAVDAGTPIPGQVTIEDGPAAVTAAAEELAAALAAQAAADAAFRTANDEAAAAQAAADALRAQNALDQADRDAALAAANAAAVQAAADAAAAQAAADAAAQQAALSEADAADAERAAQTAADQAQSATAAATALAAQNDAARAAADAAQAAADQAATDAAQAAAAAQQAADGAAAQAAQAAQAAELAATTARAAANNATDRADEATAAQQAADAAAANADQAASDLAEAEDTYQQALDYAVYTQSLANTAAAKAIAKPTASNILYASMMQTQADQAAANAEILRGLRDDATTAAQAAQDALTQATADAATAAQAATQAADDAAAAQSAADAAAQDADDADQAAGTALAAAQTAAQEAAAAQDAADALAAANAADQAARNAAQTAADQAAADATATATAAGTAADAAADQAAQDASASVAAEAAAQAAAAQAASAAAAAAQALAAADPAALAAAQAAADQAVADAEAAVSAAQAVADAAEIRVNNAIAAKAAADALSPYGQVTGTGLFTDPAGRPLVYSVTNPSTGGGTVTIDPTTGAFLYTPTRAQRYGTDLNPTDTITITAFNGVNYASMVVTVTIAPLDNAAPYVEDVAVDSPNPANGVVIGSVIAGDPNGDTLTYSGGGVTPRGSVVVNSDGTFTYTPTAQARHQAARNGGLDIFEVTIDDGFGLSTTVPVTVTISPLNTAPTATAEVGQPDANGRVAVRVTAFDADSDPLTRSVSIAPAHGSATFDAQAGVFVYTPTDAARHQAAGSGPTSDNFSIVVDDGYGGSVVLPVTVAISPSNAAPVASFANADPEPSDGAVRGAVTATDADNDTLSWRITSGPSNGTVTLDPATGDYVYTPSVAARSALAEWDQTAVGSGLQYITLGDPARVTQGTFSISSGTLGNISQLSQPGSSVRNFVATYFTATDTQTYTFGQTDAPVDTVMVLYSGEFDPNNPGIGAIVLNDDWRTHSNVGATVSSRGCGTTSFCPQVSANLNAGQTVTLVVTTWRSDMPLGLPQTFYANGAGRLTASAPPDETDAFTVQVSDGYGGTRDVRVTVPILEGVAPPVAGSPTVNAADTGTGVVTGTLGFTDRASLPLTYSVTGTSTGGATVTVDPATGAFTYTPTLAQRQAAGGSTIDTFLGTAGNGTASTNQTVSVFVDPGTPVAGTPTVGSPTITTRSYNSSFLAASPSSTTVFPNTSLSQIVNVSGYLQGAWVGSNATPFFFTNNGNVATVQLQMRDSIYAKMVKVQLVQSGSNVVASVLYAKYAASGYYGANFDSLGAATAAPIATSGSAAGYGVSNLTITTDVTTGSASFSDTAGRSLTYSTPATSTGGGRVSINATTGAFTYTPSAAQYQSATSSTTDTFTVTARNGAGRTATQTITVYVKGNPV